MAAGQQRQAARVKQEVIVAVKLESEPGNEGSSSEEGEDVEAVDEDEEDEDDEEEEEEEDPRSEGSQIQVTQDMESLYQSLPTLVAHYHLLDRLGEGTFSSVYKAADLNWQHYDNDAWLWTGTQELAGAHEPELVGRIPSGAPYDWNDVKGRPLVAIKRIYVTSSPARIMNELEILGDLRGASNIAYLIEAIRFEDQVVAVMPYNRHQDFRAYFRSSPLSLMRNYFHCLFTALATMHKAQIVHRDVKPANFLFDTITQTGSLCDFGLAQKIGGDEWIEWRGECLHSLPGPALGGTLAAKQRANKKVLALKEGHAPGLSSGLHGQKLKRPISLFTQWQTQYRESRDLVKEANQIGATLALQKSVGTNGSSSSAAKGIPVVKKTVTPAKARQQALMAKHISMKPWKPSASSIDEMKRRHAETKTFYSTWDTHLWSSAMKPPTGRHGFLKVDNRPQVRANRAGTRGFRAPEVLLKCPDQTVGIDIWSVGIILLSFLTRRFPFFNSNDDTEALVEIAAIFGAPRMGKCAFMHNRTFSTNVPDYDQPAHADLHALVKSLNPAILVEHSPNPSGPIPSSAADDAEWYKDSELWHAVDLLKRCLELEVTKRWTAEECLQHPFFINYNRETSTATTS